MPLSNEELTYLRENEYIPSQKYFSKARFVESFETSSEVWARMGATISGPIANSLYAIYAAMRAIWAVTRALGNLFILKISNTGDALKDFCSYGLLTMGLIIMAPIHLLSGCIEIFTRAAASWFSPEPAFTAEPFLEMLQKGYDTMASTMSLPRKGYFEGFQFFTAYRKGSEFVLEGLGGPFFMLGNMLVSSMLAFAGSIILGIVCLTNLAIGHTAHAKSSFSQMSCCLTLGLLFAFMAPINTTFQAIASVTRLGTSWVSACTSSESSESSASLQPA